MSSLSGGRSSPHAITISIAGTCYSGSVAVIQRRCFSGRQAKPIFVLPRSYSNRSGYLVAYRKLETRVKGYQMVYISRSCFRFARHNTGACRIDGRTDRRTDRQTRRCEKATGGNHFEYPFPSPPSPPLPPSLPSP